MKSEEIEFADVQPEKFYVIKVLCNGCQDVLVESKTLDGADLKDSWAQLTLTKGFNTPKCPKGCPASFSDFNISTEMKIYEVEDDHS